MKFMGRSHLLPAEHDEYLDRIGLTDEDKRVYIATLDSGLVSVGEIQQLTKIEDLSHIIESIRDLVDIGLIKKAQGRMPRYYAILPFMRETVSIEKEFTLALDSMITAINQNRASISSRREEIVSIEFPNFIQELLDSYYHKILSPTLEEYEKMHKMLQENSVNQIREIQNYNSTVKEEIRLMMKPFNEFASKMNDNYADILNTVNSALEGYFNHQQSSNEDLLRSVFEEIKSKIDALKTSSTNFGKGVIENVTEIETFGLSAKKAVYELSVLHNEYEQELASNTNIINDLKSEIISVREGILNEIREIEGVENTEIINIVEKKFSGLSMKIDDISLNQSIQKRLGSEKEMLEEFEEKIKVISEKLLLDNSSRASVFNELISEIGKSISNVLNQISVEQTTSHNLLETEINDEIISMSSKLKENGITSIELVNKHISKVLDNHDLITDKWEQNLTVQYEKPGDIILPIINDWVDNIKPVIDNFKAQTDGMFAKIVAPLIEFENQSIATLIERIRFVKVMVEGRSADLNSIIEFAKSFDYTKSSDTWVVVGLPSIYASLTDMILRTRVKVTVVIPNIDLELVEIIRKIRSTIRITFVTDIDTQTDARFISKMKDTGRVVLRAYDKKDLYACIRDSEEIILGYRSMDEEMVAIRASTPSIVQLLEDRLNETVIRNSKVL